MKVMAITGSNQNFGSYHRVIKELEKGAMTTIYSGNRVVGIHNVASDGFVRGMRTFADGSFVRYSSLSPKSRALSFNVTGKLAGEIDDGLLSVKGGIVDGDFVEKNPDFVMTRKGIIDGLKAHLQRLKDGLKTGEVKDITGKEF